MERKQPEIIFSDGTTASDNVRIEMQKMSEDEDLIYRYKLVNDGKKVRIKYVYPLIYEIKLDVPLNQVRFFVHGYHSFSGTGSFHLEEKEIDTVIPHLRQCHRNFHNPKQTEKGFLTSAMFSVLTISQHKYLTLGFLDCHRFCTQVRTEIAGNYLRIITQVQMEDLEVPAKGEIQLPDIFESRIMPWRALTRYADILSKAMNVKITPDIPTGWCSWYHYFTSITEKEFLKNLEIAKNFDPQMTIFQLDDGFQPFLGEWFETNSKFPSGLEALAKKVHQADKIPGIWTAPFIAQKTTPIIIENPDWLLKDKNNDPVVAMWNMNWGMFKYAYALDVSHTDVQDYLYRVYRKLYDVGYRFFKIDFLFAASLPGEYAAKGQTSLEVIRTGLEVIRSAVKDSLILGCGCPLEAGLGIVDTIRVGNDVTPYWSNYADQFIGGGFEQLSTKNCIRNTLARGFMQGKLFQNDPDCIITRRTQNRLSENETLTLAQVNALSGGPLMVSDDLEKLDPDRIQLLQDIFALQAQINQEQRVFFAPDFMDNRIPTLQVALGLTDAFLGVYNFSDNSGNKTIELKRFIPWDKCRIINYWTQKELIPDEGTMTTDVIDVHGSRLYHIQKME